MYSCSLLITSLLALGAVALPPRAPAPGSIPTIRARQASATSNDFVDGGDCKPVTYIFARGTTEPGNMGTTVGPALEDALKQKLGADNIAVQGVDYPADFAGAIQGSTDPKGSQGAQRMAQLTWETAMKCPNSQVVLVGYSQGAQQVHGALMNLDGENNVKAAVTFGDPLQDQPFNNIDQADTKVFCNPGDAVCQNQFIITAAHLSYPQTSVPEAADFIQSRLQG